MSREIGQREIVLMLAAWFACSGFWIDRARSQDEQGDPSKKRMSTSQAMTLVPSIIETILKEHVAPPTRQQMVLEFIQQLGRRLNKPVSLDLGVTISDARDHEKVYAILTAELQRMAGDDLTTEVLLSSLNAIGNVLEGGLAIDTRFNVVAEEQLAANRYVGIGVQTKSVRQGQIAFMKVFENGPAFDVGILDNDILDSVDGKSIRGLSMTDTVQLLRGPVGTAVKLTVTTAGGSPREVTLVRRVIPLRTMELVETNKDHGALLVRVDRISASSLNELQNIVSDAESVGGRMRIIVLNLQNTLADNVHNLHLFADGILDATTLCSVQTRKGTRLLKTEDGKTLDERRVVLLTPPRSFEAIGLLANICADANLPVFYWSTQMQFEQSTPITIEQSIPIQIEQASRQVRLPVVEPFEIVGSDYFIKIATCRFLDNKGNFVSPRSLMTNELDTAMHRKGRPLKQTSESILKCILDALDK